MFTQPTTSQFQALFARDFPFGTNAKTQVMSADIQNAYNLAALRFNPALLPADGTSQQLGFMYLAAHFLVLNLRASSQGINGQYNFLQNMKGVGPVSEGFAIPERIAQSPTFAMLCKTQYGARYVEMIAPQLCGQIGTSRGHSKAV